MLTRTVPTVKSKARSNQNTSKGRDLSGAVLSFANLIGADLSGADLDFADLSDANLSGANPDCLTEVDESQ